MEKPDLLSHTRWDLLQQISAGKQTASEIAKGASTSLPNASQQLRLLEAHNLLAVQTEKRDAPGKPRQQYRIRKPFCHLTVVTQYRAERSFFHLSDIQELLLNIFFLPQDEQPFLLKGLCENEGLMEHCSIAYVRSADAIEILLLTEDVETVRNKYSNIQATFHDKSRKIAAWTHSVEELNEGIEKGDDYFLHLTKHKIIYDPQGRFEKVNI